MSEILTATIGVGMFYLLLNPQRIRDRTMFLGACIALAVSVLVQALAPFGADQAKWALVLRVLATVAALGCLYIAINPFQREPSASATTPTQGGDEGETHG